VQKIPEKDRPLPYIARTEDGPVKVYKEDELRGALKKAGVKLRSSSSSGNDNWQKQKAKETKQRKEWRPVEFETRRQIVQKFTEGKLNEMDALRVVLGLLVGSTSGYGEGEMTGHEALVKIMRDRDKCIEPALKLFKKVDRKAMWAAIIDIAL